MSTSSFPILAGCLYPTQSPPDHPLITTICLDVLCTSSISILAGCSFLCVPHTFRSLPVALIPPNHPVITTISFFSILARCSLLVFYLILFDPRRLLLGGVVLDSVLCLLECEARLGHVRALHLVEELPELGAESSGGVRGGCSAF